MQGKPLFCKPNVICLLLMVLLLSLALVSCQRGPKRPPLRFTEANSGQPVVESMLYNLAIVWRPANNTTVDLNPPRFSWPYEPTIMLEEGDERDFLPVRHYRFQITLDRKFETMLIDVVETPFNFYNTIHPLPTGRPIYWRVGYYDPEQMVLQWQEVRVFKISAQAVDWDRSGLAEPKFLSTEHPRIIFTKKNIEALRRLAVTHPFSREIYERVLADAEADLTASWFKDFPGTDTMPGEQLRRLHPDIPPWPDPDGGDAVYLLIIERLMNMAFAYMLTGDERFLAVVERLKRVAAYRTGGETSPEGLGGSEDYVALNEYLSLFYDWFYDHLSPARRSAVLGSLRWRTEHIVNNYSWRQRKGTRVYPYSIAVCGSSHPFENINYTVPAGLAAYEAGGVFRTTYQLAVNYYSGVNNPFGPEDSWNEGPGYGLSKFKWMMYAICYYDMSLEEANFGLNPFLDEIGGFFTRMAPLGLRHLSFGNIGIMEPYYLNNRLSSFRKLAYLTSDKRFLQSWEDAGRRLEQIGYSRHRKYSRPWIEYALPFYYPEPELEPEISISRLFPDGGWVGASTLYPGRLDNFKNSLGINFHARPRGAFNHSFFGDNSFQIYAYGQNITHAGGSTQNGDRHANHSMSQNVVLVDGLGQAQPNHSRMRNFRKKLFKPYAARIARYLEQDATVYFKGEAANSYIQYPYRYQEFWGHLGDGETNPYDEKDLSYLTRADRHVLFVDGRYFVMLDDLAVSKDRPGGSRFSWLYHVLQDVPLNWDEETLSFSYRIEDVTTLVKVICAEEFAFENRQKQQGLVNPITGENYTEWVRKIERYDNNYNGPYPEVVTHNIWITNRNPAHELRFLTVIYPYREGDPVPLVQPVDDLTVRVSCGGKTEMVTFAPDIHPKAEVQVEL